MAQDQVDVMAALGYDRFFLAGHDRGARTAHRLALDHPGRVRKVALLDILPTRYVWGHPSREWALNSWHWSFMAQPDEMFERMIAAIPAREFVLRHLGRSGKPAFFDDRALAETSAASRRRRFTVPARTIARPRESISRMTRPINRPGAGSPHRR